MDSSLESSSSSQGHLARCSRTCKIIVIGDAGVGKTCLTHRFCTGQFPSRTEATIGLDFREKLLEIEGEKIRVQLWDTAGQERFRKSMVQHYYRNVHGVVFVFDVTNPSSFCNLPLWMDECHQQTLGQDVPCALVCNKADLASGTTSVLIEQARHLAEVHRMSFYLTSAKGDQVDNIFVTLAQKSKNKRGQSVNECVLLSSRAVAENEIPAGKKTERDVRKKWACFY
ncbi:ras-related protein Rab-33B [Triplophysa rosa]|uniref:Ras-related protein Rab-33B-like n=1 Tax=Triplophysa rosa TaxID=992332 RepID=A0A9W7WZV2_TRIRA|nr:ras-related protein Rab-33B [Triplophysa rosa]KAI7811224.1 putative ras-related protein Rab-33B-like [Triplophysa rosa]